MKCYLRMGKGSLKDKIINEETQVLIPFDCPMSNIKTLKLKYFGHVSLEKHILEAQM